MIRCLELVKWNAVFAVLATSVLIACGSPDDGTQGPWLAKKASALAQTAGKTYVASSAVLAIANNGNFDTSKGRLFWDDAGPGSPGGIRLPAAMTPSNTWKTVDNSIAGPGTASGVRCLGGAAGDWCGSNANVVGGQAKVLYHCIPNAPATNARICTASCLPHPGHDDTCSPNTVSELVTTSSDNQCAAFAILASGAPGTHLWRPAIDRVVDHCPIPGTVIATFATGTYGPGDHAAMLVSCSSTLLEVFDSNFVDYYCTGGGATCTDHVARHTLSLSGSGPNNAGNYHVVVVP